ncbi:hypothetical protein BU15DRAFT_65334 [Melanogaster broomeanus]|nr:hypothetical protein BU15DRAFT_65334 [Melanogaster broomeanus]
MAVLVTEGRTGIGKETASKRRYGDQGIVSTSSHPGGIRTKLWRHAGSFTTAMRLYAVTVPDGTSLNGKYLVPSMGTHAQATCGHSILGRKRALDVAGGVSGERSLMVAAMGEHQLNDLHVTAQQIMKEVDGLQPHQGYMLGSSDELLMS